MKKVIIAILTGPFHRCLYAKDLFVDKIGQLMNYALPIEETYNDGRTAKLKVNESIYVIFSLSESGYVTKIDVEEIS